jgi:hypothetical protein
MPDDSSPPSPPVRATLAPFTPRGGSKWAHRFGWAKTVTVSGADVLRSESAVVHLDGTVTESGAAPEMRDEIVFTLAAGEKVSLGRFLLGGLACVPEGAVCCGAALTARQAEVMRKLGFFSGYITLATPARFRAVLSATVADVPGPHIKGIAERLWSRSGMTGAAVAILPPRETERFALTNRASLTAWLRARRITVIEPEVMPLDALAECLAAAGIVVLADPEQAGLLGLCSAGAKILEIAPEGWLGVQARWLAEMFGLRWTAFLAAAPGYPLLGELPFGALVPMSYDVPIRALGKTLDTLD